jgi:hypothetical protein
MSVKIGSDGREIRLLFLPPRPDIADRPDMSEAAFDTEQKAFIARHLNKRAAAPSDHANASARPSDCRETSESIPFWAVR